MDDNSRKQEQPAPSTDPADKTLVGIVVLFSSMSFLIPLLFLQKGCTAFPFVLLFPLPIGVVVGVVYACYWLPHWRKHVWKLRGYDDSMLAGIVSVLLVSFAVTILAALAGIALVGDLVMFSSHTEHDYDATVSEVLRRPKETCKTVYFTDPILQDSVDACVRHFDDVQSGSRVHVHALSGPLGIRILSVQRISSE